MTQSVRRDVAGETRTLDLSEDAKEFFTVPWFHFVSLCVSRFKTVSNRGLKGNES